jgi:hypothetical protein
MSFQARVLAESLFYEFVDAADRVDGRVPPQRSPDDAEGDAQASTGRLLGEGRDTYARRGSAAENTQIDG